MCSLFPLGVLDVIRKRTVSVPGNVLTSANAVQNIAVGIELCQFPRIVPVLLMYRQNMTVGAELCQFLRMFLPLLIHRQNMAV